MIDSVLKSGKYCLIDVREPMELETNGFIDIAINIPLGEVEERHEEINKLGENIIFFCRSGNRSGKAVELFRNLGYNNTYNGGGFEEMKLSLDNLK